MIHRLPDLPPQHPPADVLETVEVLFPAGAVRYRLTRYLSADGTKSVRHGQFTAYHEDGTLAGDGAYRDGLEVGLWRDFYENGQRAAEGYYDRGEEQGHWRFWLRDGTEQEPVEYLNGTDVRDLPPDYDPLTAELPPLRNP